ncbi:hypothetical protein CNMCM5793_001516 [Aspergillus hiratsukae]|uniref:Uncharacterized protein n=1 Tax=Aspergillus hiratsukae TaxID=1194566 RepID=A0A8H6PB95_9EURO|nr:hypothetical protein CNMCM5793_001516 [Aspergillus hiratsukae]
MDSCASRDGAQPSKVLDYLNRALQTELLVPSPVTLDLAPTLIVVTGSISGPCTDLGLAQETLDISALASPRIGAFDTFDQGRVFIQDDAPVYLPPWVDGPIPTVLPQKIKAARDAIRLISEEIDQIDAPQKASKRLIKLARYAAIPRPADPELLMPWILQRYNAWSFRAPSRRDDPFKFYVLPEDATAFFEKEQWPDRVTGITGELRIPLDTKSFPWGTPASALHYALKGCPGYSNDTVYDDDAHTLLGDIGYPTRPLQSESSKPDDHNATTVKASFRYVRRNAYRIELGREPSEGLVGYVDSSFQDHIDGRFSEAYIFFFAGSPISWHSKKQTLIASSSTIAEYCAYDAAFKDAIWLRKLLRALCLESTDEPIPVHTDSDNADEGEGLLPHSPLKTRTNTEVAQASPSAHEPAGIVHDVRASTFGIDQSPLYGL